MTEYVYRIVVKWPGAEEWVPYRSANSATGRPYTKKGTAAGVATDAGKYWTESEFKVQRARVEWEDVSE